jgi:hypothetical protein
VIEPQIISNPKLTVRVKRLHNEMARQGVVDYKLWPSIHLPHQPARTAISKAHKQIVEWAANEGVEEVCIFEDDIWFPSEYGWQYFLNNKPKEYDLYLSGLTRGEIINGIVKRYTGQFGYFIHERFYDTFLRTDEKLDIDGAQSNRGEFHICYPFAAFCYPGWSDNVRGAMDYSHLLIGREVYGFGLINSKEDAKRFSDLANSHATLPVSS